MFYGECFGQIEVEVSPPCSTYGPRNVIVFNLWGWGFFSCTITSKTSPSEPPHLRIWPPYPFISSFHGVFPRRSPNQNYFINDPSSPTNLAPFISNASHSSHLVFFNSPLGLCVGIAYPFSDIRQYYIFPYVQINTFRGEVNFFFFCRFYVLVKRHLELS